MKVRMFTLMLLGLALGALGTGCGGKCEKLKEQCAKCPGGSMEKLACEAAVSANDNGTCAEALDDKEFFATCNK